MAYAVRSSRVGTAGFRCELQQVVWSVNPNLPLAAVQTLDEIRAVSMAQTSFAMVMLAIAGSVALLLGIVEIYSVITYVATQRIREVGIRMALGAQARDVRKMFLRHGLRLTAAGTALGIGLALVVTRVMSGCRSALARWIRSPMSPCQAAWARQPAISRQADLPQRARPPSGTKVVTAGAALLFGAEFEVGR